ncbi:UNVERIFIED_CONTAM: hypothetical protein GTU68_009828, partial [Idotea baltica]|nr:hypothetical protein [Idotea baltica]
LVFIIFRDERLSYGSNIQAGLLAGLFFFLIISVLAFPNGPFTRPHPAVWRCVFGLSVLYMLALTFAIFQDYNTVRGIFEWFFPELKNFTIDMDKGEWGEKCDDLTFERLWLSFDFFCFAHFAGWTLKTLLVRHYGILWTISVMWEITELASLSLRDIQTTSGKLKRAVLQFTPESWTAMRWLDPACTYMRFLAVCQIVVFWQVSELNTFFIKHIFEMPPDHPFVFLRIFLLGAMSAPSLRQYYSYVTEPRCKRVGTQCWVYVLCVSIESLICIKFGGDVFQKTQIRNLVAWLLVQAAGSVLCVYLCVMYSRWARKRRDDSFDDLDSESRSSVCSFSRGANTPRDSPRKTVTLSTPESDRNDGGDSDSERGGVETRLKKHPLDRVYRKRRNTPK